MTSFCVGSLAGFDEPVAELSTQLSNANTLSLIWRNYPITGWRYSLQQSPDLNPAYWLTVPKAPEVNGSSISVSMPVTETKAYFRLVRAL
jgi:hypothetical protein